jgi:phage baseplate assembly protein gpV
MSIINFIKEVKKTELGEQQFVGKVVVNNDPKKLGRIKIRVTELFGTAVQIPDENLPWACKMDGHFLGNGSKEFSVPSIGTFVFLYFSKGDIYSPVYTGEVQSKNNFDSEQEEDYTNLVLKKDRNGNKIKSNLASNQLNIVYNGKIIATVSDKVTINAGAGLEVIISGKNVENISGNKEITAAKVKITAPVEITGSVTITGNISATGTGSISGALSSGPITSPAATIGGKPFATHTHGGVTPGGGATGPVI